MPDEPRARDRHARADRPPLPAGQLPISLPPAPPTAARGCTDRVGAGAVVGAVALGFTMPVFGAGLVASAVVHLALRAARRRGRAPLPA